MITLRTGLPSKACFTASSAKTAASISGFCGVPGHRDITALLAVDLHHQRDGVFDQQIAFDLRARPPPKPARTGRAPASTPRPDAASSGANSCTRMTAASRTAQARSGAGCSSPGRATSASALANSRIWARQTLKCSRSMPVEHLVAARHGRPCAPPAPRRRTQPGVSAGADLAISAAIRSTIRHSRCTKREAPLTRFLAPDHVAIRRRIRQHEPARGVGAVGAR